MNHHDTSEPDASGPAHHRTGELLGSGSPTPPPGPAASPNHPRRRRVRTWAGTVVAATVTAVLVAAAPVAAADPVVPAGTPCASQLQAFYNARQALQNHNDEPHVFGTQQQVDSYDAEGRAIYDAQVRAQQTALTCLRALAGRAAPPLPDPVQRPPRTQSSPYPSAPPAPPSSSVPGGESYEDWVEKMQDKIYDWFKENLERLEKYQEKQDEQRREQDRCAQARQAPATTPADAPGAMPTSAPPVCPAAPSTTATPPGTP